MKVSDLRGILQYVPRFRDRIFVIAIDGEIIGSENFPNLLLDIAVLRSLNIKVVLVHGAGHQTTQLAKERGLSISNHDGTGVTDEPTLRLSLEAASRLTNEIMQGLTTVDLRAAFANSIISHPAGILGGVDFLYTGKVEKVDVKSLQLFLNDGIVPVIPPVGFDGEGRTYRVNSDSIAVEIAEALQAAKVIFVSSNDGLLVNGQIVRQISIADTEDLLKRKRATLEPGLASKLDHAARACHQGVPRVHLINGTVDEALLTEIFSNEGIGTMIHSNEYQQIRRMYKKDVRNVMSLIRQSVKNEELVRRTRSDIVAQLEDYWLLEVDRSVVGCVALHPHPAEGKAELACLYVSNDHKNQGYGGTLMAFVDNLARERGYREIFALSTQAYRYLMQKGGYQEAPIESLPASRREKFETSGRNSRVLVRTIQPKTA